MDRLKGKIALITGGGTGIGKATCKKFATEGAEVVVVDINETEGSKTTQEIVETGGKAIFLQANVADKSSVKELFATVATQYGRLDILVNNAGIVRDSSLKKLSEEDFDKVIDVNLKGVFLCTQEGAELMKENGGAILNASSVVAHYGNYGQTNYVAAKSGVIGITKVWARELGKYNIRVNAVAPGFIKTTMLESVPDNVLDMMTTKVPLRRMGQPEDIANMYCFLGSDEATYVTGAVFNVDGGLTF